MTNSFKRYHSNRIKEIITGTELYDHLMQDGYLPDSWVLPPFIKITDTKKEKRGDGVIRAPKVLFAPKSKLKWRQFSFIHPNNYQQVCHVLGGNEYKNAILKLSKSSKIFSYTLPQIYKNQTENAVKNIARWNDLQDDILIDSDKYEYILVLDISNCYHTMYTHSIEWAFASTGDKKTGTKLDEVIRNGMEGRTHGLPVGSAVSHYISEIVLLYIDRSIEDNKLVTDFIGGRFRDNYYLLCKTRQDAEMLLKQIITILRKNNLDFNSEKTKIIKQGEYFDNFWRIDFNTILSKLNIDDKNEAVIKMPIRKIEAFIGLSLRLSKDHNNDVGVIDRLVSILEKIEPENDLYPKYFSLVQRAYQIRTQSLPKVLGMLSLLATKNSYCKKRLTQFLVSRIAVACQSRDNFELMWVIYFLSINGIKVTKEIAKYLEKIKSFDDAFLSLICTFYEKSLQGTVSKHGDLFNDLWGVTSKNTSNLTAKFDTLTKVEDIIEVFKIKFTTLFGGGGFY